jgi:hypothetical protein
MKTLCTNTIPVIVRSPLARLTPQRNSLTVTNTQSRMIQQINSTRKLTENIENISNDTAPKMRHKTPETRSRRKNVFSEIINTVKQNAINHLSSTITPSRVTHIPLRRQTPISCPVPFDETRVLARRRSAIRVIDAPDHPQSDASSSTSSLAPFTAFRRQLISRSAFLRRSFSSKKSKSTEDEKIPSSSATLKHFPRRLNLPIATCSKVDNAFYFNSNVYCLQVINVANSLRKEDDTATDTLLPIMEAPKEQDIKLEQNTNQFRPTSADSSTLSITDLIHRLVRQFVQHNYNSYSDKTTTTLATNVAIVSISQMELLAMQKCKRKLQSASLPTDP